VVQIDVTVLTETGDYSSWSEFVIRSEPYLRKFFGELLAAQKRRFVFQRQRERRWHGWFHLRVAWRGSFGPIV